MVRALHNACLDNVHVCLQYQQQHAYMLAHSISTAQQMLYCAIMLDWYNLHLDTPCLITPLLQQASHLGRQAATAFKELPRHL
jgi:hypothetical protein